MAEMLDMELRRSESGQAMTEYIILVTLCFVAIMGFMIEFLEHVGEFYMNLVRVVCLPLP